MPETIVIMTDVHANARAFRRALELARQGPMDRLVILGDLLTYGLDVSEVVDLTREAQQRHNADLLLGNHDQLYLDLSRGVRAYYDALPAWIQESVDHTVAQLDIHAFADGLVWSREVNLGETLLSHANPYDFGDWTYLNSEEENRRAAEKLGERGHRIGVFGHTHRRLLYEDAPEGRRSGFDSKTFPSAELSSRVLVVNPGSIGQPRGGRGGSSFLRLHRSPDAIRLEFVDVDYDYATHVADLRRAPMSPATLDRLAGFFVPSSVG